MSMSDRNYSELVERMVARLKESRKVLFLTTSNRWVGEKGGETPKSTRLAYHIADMVGEGRVEVIEVPKLNIYPCEGNVSTARGDTCGLKSARLKDDEKNPSGHHRCWASFNNEDDELWKVSKPLFEADTVVFFGSVRWGQMNSFYQKLIERLTWLENRHTGLGESNLLAEKNAGIVIVGQNWNGAEVLKTQRQVLEYFGFRVSDELCFNWQYTDDPEDESGESYKNATPAFERDFGL